MIETIYHGDHFACASPSPATTTSPSRCALAAVGAIPAAGETLELAFHAQDCLALDPVKLKLNKGEREHETEDHPARGGGTSPLSTGER